MRCVFPDALKPSGIIAWHMKTNNKPYWAHSEARAAMGQSSLGKRNSVVYREDSKVGHDIKLQQKSWVNIKTISHQAVRQNWIRLLKSFTEHFMFWGAVVSLLTTESGINYIYLEHCLFIYLPGCRRLMEENCTAVKIHFFFFPFIWERNRVWNSILFNFSLFFVPELK